MTEIRRTKLTKRVVDALKPAATRYVVWDTALPGFGIAVQPSGHKSFLLKYRAGGGRGGTVRKPSIGAHGAVTCDQARDIAEDWLARVRAGGDPSAERRERRDAPTVAELAERYVDEHAAAKKKPSSVRMDRTNLRLHVLPRLGRRRVADVTRADIARLHHEMRATPGAANRVLALLSRMFTLAERWSLRPDNSNPCRHVERFPERKMERFLSEAELARLGATLSEVERTGEESPAAIAAVRLLILTGARLSEILTLRWDYIDWDRTCLRLPDSKTRAKVVPLGAPALQILAALSRQSEWVVPGREPGSHLVNLRKAWGRIRRRAGLDGMRLHDLRHSFASVGAGAGLGLPVIGKLLGHSQAATTQRYAHVADDPLRAAADRIAGRIAATMGGGTAEVTPLIKSNAG